MAPPGDFVYKAFRDATYYYVNAAPQFRFFDNKAWMQMEQAVQDYAIRLG